MSSKRKVKRRCRPSGFGTYRSCHGQRDRRNFTQCLSTLLGEGTIRELQQEKAKEMLDSPWEREMKFGDCADFFYCR